MIEVENLTFTYGRQTPVFAGFNWHAGRGEAWALTGPSGCGKTTLLYLLAGLREPTAGTIRIAGEPVTRPRPRTGLILQDHGLLPWATVEENVRLGLTIRAMYGPDGRHAPAGETVSRAEGERRVRHWLGRLGIVELANKFPAQVSGGQRQRTAIARTLVLEPDLLLMDEPFSALDAPTREDLQNLTAALQQETGLTTVLVTHNIEEAAFLGRRIMVLGEPPNRTPVVVENPGTPTADTRSSIAYLETVSAVRVALGAAS